MRIALHTRRQALRSALASCLGTLGCEVRPVGDARELGEAVASHSAELAIVDLDDPAARRQIEALRSRFPTAPVLALSSDARAETVVEARLRGASELLLKPFGRKALARAIARAAALPAAGEFQDELHFDRSRWIAVDPVSLELQRSASEAARGDATLLITGDIGTGKTHLARCMHQHGPRSATPLVEFCCAERSGEEAIARLVGRCSSDPRDRVTGAFERAAGGTLLIEDVDELEAPAQEILLAYLADGRVRALGSAAASLRDVRIIATARTHRRDAGDVQLSQELRTRLGVITLSLRPLRERTGDIAPLAEHFLRKAFGSEVPPTLDDLDLEALSTLRLPGNAAELQNLMLQLRLRKGLAAATLDDADLVALCGATSGRVADGPTESQPRPAAANDTEDDPRLAALNLREIERHTVERSLEIAKGNRTVAARALGVSTRTLRTKIRAYGLR